MKLNIFFRLEIAWVGTRQKLVSSNKFWFCSREKLNLHDVKQNKKPSYAENLKFTTFSFDLTCNHLNISKKSYLLRYIRHCRRIAPYVKFYKQQIDYYNWTANNILQIETGLILPSFNNSNRKKRFLTTILGTIASKVIGLAFEGISSFLHHKRHNAHRKQYDNVW